MTDENPYATPESEVSVTDINNTDLASRGRRFGGALIDSIIAMVIVWPVLDYAGAMDRAMAGEQPVEDLIGSALLGVVVYLVLHGYLLATRGQTIGKYFASTRIVSIEDKKILPMWKIVLLRFLPVSLLPYLPVVGQVLSLVNVLIIFRNDRRCGHDHIAGTIVVNAD